jgi:DNA replication protein DnaC
MYASAALDRTPDGKLFNATTRKRLESWPRQERMMLVIGPRGCGKTHCGWARARDLARSGLKTFFVDLLKWQADWEHAISGFQRARAERMENAIRRAPFAILDDLSGTTASDRWNHELQSVLDERIGNRLATWVTTAADLDAVAEKFNPAIASRLQMFFQTTLPPRDWREYRAPKPEPEARTHDFEGEL